MPLPWKRLDRHLGANPAIGPHPAHATLVQAAGAQLIQQPHPLDDRPARATQVDGLAARTDTVGELDHHDLVAGTGQPVREGGPGDARAADQDGRLGHAAQPTGGQRTTLA